MNTLAPTASQPDASDTVKARRTRWRRLLPDMSIPTGEQMSPAALHALAILLLLVQLPHLFHLPLWVSLSGASLTLLRLVLSKHPRQRWLGLLLSPISVTLMAILAALLIRQDYGYFIGRDPCVAFLFLLVAAKFAEVRRPGDATLLLCLAAFLLLTQYFYSQSILAAALSLPAVIALTHALAVLRAPADDRQAVRESLRLAVTLLIQGLPLAAILFLLFPRLPGPLWSLPEDASASSGLSDSMSPGSIGQLSLSDAVAFRVEFDGQVPAPRDRYWRGPVLSEFDGRHWSSTRRRIAANASYRGSDSDIIKYTVTLQPHNQRWLFALDAAVSLPGNGNGQTLGRMMSDGQMLALSPVKQALRYRQSSVLLDAISTSQRPHDSNLFLPGINTRSHAFARDLRNRSADDTDYAQAVMQYFNRESFHYTLRPQLLGSAPVDEFLFDSRSGFCEHYAAAFVVLMRAAGIPSRVVTGYQGGEMNNDYMIVRQSDAHAWAEAYIDGAWRRYDPTSAVAPSRVEQGLAAALPNESSVPRMARLDGDWLSTARLRWDALNHQWQRLVIDFDDESQESLWQKLGLSTPALWQLTAIVLLASLIWSLLLLGLPRRSDRGLSIDERLWKRLCSRLARRHLTRRPAESDFEFLQRAATSWPARADELLELQQTFRQLRFQALEPGERNRHRQQIRQGLRRLNGWLPALR